MGYKSLKAAKVIMFLRVSAKKFRMLNVDQYILMAMQTNWLLCFVSQGIKLMGQFISKCFALSMYFKL